MKAKQRRNTSITYQYIDPDKEESDDFRLNHYENIKNFIDNRFPRQKHLISVYLHYAMIMVEELGRKEELDFDKNSWSKLSKKWKDIFFSMRNDLTKEQRLAFFIIRARFDSLKELIKNKLFESEKDDYKLEELKNLLVDTHSLKEATVSLFWIKFILLEENFFKLRYSKALHRFFKRFYIVFGNFIWKRSTDEELFNNPLYCNPGKDGFNNVNNYFIESCEYKMSGMQMMLDSFKKIVYPRLLVNEVNCHSPTDSRYICYKKSQKQTIFYWIFELIKKNFLEASEKNFQELMYKTRINPGDLDRFVDENKYHESMPFNILAMYKKTLFDQIADLFDKKEALLFVFEEYMESFRKTPNENKDDPKKQQNQKDTKKDKSRDIFDSFLFNNDDDDSNLTSQQKYNVDVTLFCLTLSMLNYGYQQLYMIKDSFQMSFFIDDGYISQLYKIQETKKVLETINLSKKIPLFYYHFNDVYIFYKERFIQFQDFLSCYIHWVRLCCEDKEILGIPYEGVDLIKQYALLFPENTEWIKQVSQARKTKNKHQQTLSLPSFYQQNDNDDMAIVENEHDVLETELPF